MEESTIDRIRDRKTVEFSVAEPPEDEEVRPLEDGEVLKLEFPVGTPGNVFLITASASGRGAGTLEFGDNFVVLKGKFDYGEGHVHELAGVITPARPDEKVGTDVVDAHLFLDFGAFVGTAAHAMHRSSYVHSHRKR